MSDWIDTFVDKTSEVPSPEIFRLWSGIATISGALERRVWSEGKNGPIFAHIFVILVGPPASGKTNAIKITRQLWSRTTGLNLAPDNVTRESFVVAVSRALRTIINGGDSAMTFSALNIPIPEFGVFFANHDLAFLSCINNIYDSPEIYREERITVEPREIIRPHIVILAGTQPDFLGSFLPETAWGMGFTSRLMLIYHPELPPANILGRSSWADPVLFRDLERIFSLKGEMEWSDVANAALNDWWSQGGPPKPTHNRLAHYLGRRGLTVVKLAMISSASRGSSMRISIEDVERAKHWLIEAEITMPDIFHAMTQRSDAQVIADLHLFVLRSYSSIARDKRKPIPNQRIWDYLHERVPSDKIQRIIDTAEKMGRIKRGTYPDEWIPGPLRDDIAIQKEVP